MFLHFKYKTIPNSSTKISGFFSLSYTEIIWNFEVKPPGFFFAYSYTTLQIIKKQRGFLCSRGLTSTLHILKIKIGQQIALITAVDPTDLQYVAFKPFLYFMQTCKIEAHTTWAISFPLSDAKVRRPKPLRQYKLCPDWHWLSWFFGAGYPKTLLLHFWTLWQFENYSNTSS